MQCNSYLLALDEWKTSYFALCSSVYTTNSKLELRGSTALWLANAPVCPLLE